MIKGKDDLKTALLKFSTDTGPFLADCGMYAAIHRLGRQDTDYAGTIAALLGYLNKDRLADFPMDEIDESERDLQTIEDQGRASAKGQCAQTLGRLNGKIAECAFM